jgi:hypothetical protein
MVMSDDSVIVFDGRPDPSLSGGTEVGFSAWVEWSDARDSITPPTPSMWETGMCLAEATRHALERGHVAAECLPALFLNAERKQGIARTIDPTMNALTLGSLLAVDMLGFVDESILVGDPNLVGWWRSAPDEDACNMMLALRYTPVSTRQGVAQDPAVLTGPIGSPPSFLQSGEARTRGSVFVFPQESWVRHPVPTRAVPHVVHPRTPFESRPGNYRVNHRVQRMVDIRQI